jgi:hypothetical protein
MATCGKNNEIKSIALSALTERAMFVCKTGDIGQLTADVGQFRGKPGGSHR